MLHFMFGGPSLARHSVDRRRKRVGNWRKGVENESALSGSIWYWGEGRVAKGRPSVSKFRLGRGVGNINIPA